MAGMADGADGRDPQGAVDRHAPTRRATDWSWTGPHFDMEEVYSCMVDTRGDDAPAARRRLLELAGPARTPLRRPRRHLGRVARRRCPLPRRHRRQRRAGLAARARRRRRDRVRRHRAGRRLEVRPTAARPSPSSGRSGTTRTATSGAPGFGGQAFHTILPHPEDPDSVTVAHLAPAGSTRPPTAAAPGRRATRASARSSCPRASSTPSSASACTRSPGTPRGPSGCSCRTTAASTAPTTRAAPGPRSPTGCPPTSASRSWCTRTSRTPSSSSRSTAATGATRPRPRPGCGAPGTPARPGRSSATGCPTRSTSR